MAVYRDGWSVIRNTIVSLSDQDIQVNLPYVAWVCAFNTTIILGYLLLDLVFFPSPLSKSIYSPTSKLKVQPDPVVLSHGRRSPRGPDDIATAAPLLEAINRNGLVFFLLVCLLSCSDALSISDICGASSANSIDANRVILLPGW